mmetsp:Transcript_8587/g.9443  ORF Transcript_8587/g.9443 Transcript_8587/m.9443 type:complete len:506 (+) Transcript_8587:126-1643(+)
MTKIRSPKRKSKSDLNVSNWLKRGRKRSTVLLISIPLIFSILYSIYVQIEFCIGDSQQQLEASLGVDKCITSNKSNSKKIGPQNVNHVRPTMAITKGQLTWKPAHPWDAPTTDFFHEKDTGSFENCTGSFTPISRKSKSDCCKSCDSEGIHSDDGTITISCHELRYRAPTKTLQNSGKILTGVLSAASGYGPGRRNYIRSTWGSNYPGIFFLVAGPWEDIEKEYLWYQDMIWIDEDEVYKGEDSVLTYKTMSYFEIAHKVAKSEKDGGFAYAVKTDDDSYVNIHGLYEKLFQNEQFSTGTAQDNDVDFKLNYFGQCPQFQVLPSRDRTNKWPVTYTTYPEPALPLYCQGAGFGLSRSLLSCAVDNNHTANIRYMPFEDAAIGMLVERCGYKPSMIAGVKVFRADTPKERTCVNQAIPMSECYKDDPDGWPPKAPNMSNILIQHRVESKDDMVNIHKSIGLVPEWVKLIGEDFDGNEVEKVKERIDIKVKDGLNWIKNQNLHSKNR